ncbi:uncharacterized protein Z519_07019 [Cladophialophora bantiana CBS 173.52]|uniref:U6 snRNA phosphodiesterase n=1 Tax=Cladophialophora bantiana (strain ATCC 10958 / CBS 173.52 / CDC B-1940 / NIH 8579) TaxID=1442370 RepID=A0A0D2G006_CLAB1|nr:uncharacterized protein Z519_07019 [Cladophialophora bantiana CBS 173.52]KIW92037.1 hypothetical protein Z519_07019 [Cladophialophora bantiana CBS 173.52]
MVLVDYPDSSSESEEQERTKPTIKQGSGKRKAEHVEQEGQDFNRPKPSPPPLPSSFHSLYATNARSSTTDDPSLHAGRTRQVPHVVGNWPTHIYLEWYPSKFCLATLDAAIRKAASVLGLGQGDQRGNVHSFLHSELGVQLPLHISLSAPLVLKTEQRDQFQTSLESKLSQARIRPFTVEVLGLDWVANHVKTRFFLVLRLVKPENDELNRLLSICNATARQFGLPCLYADSRDTPTSLLSHSKRKTVPEMTDKSDAFHISIAWTLHEPDDQSRQELIRLADDQLRALKASFLLLKLKIGNAVIDSPFAIGRDGDR